MKKCILTFLALLWACTVWAETWEWTDSQGTVSFTDDPLNIPKQFRKSAQKSGGVGAAPAPPESPPAQAPVPSGAGQGTVAPGQPLTPIPAAKLQDAYGGKSSAQWKESFSSLNSDIRMVDGQLKEKQRLLQEPGTLSRSEYLKLEDEIRRLSASLTALLARWDLLNKEATAAGVPGELRQ